MDSNQCTNDGRIVFCQFGDTYYVGTNQTAITNGAIEGQNIKGTITIPDFYDSKPVVAVGTYAFTACEYVEHVIIGSNVKTIYTYAFGDMPNIKTMYIPASLEFIDYASIWFYNQSTGGDGKGFTQVTFAPKSQLKFVNLSFGRQDRVQIFIPDVIRPVCAHTIMQLVNKKEVFSPFSFTFCGVKSKTYLTSKCRRTSSFSLLQITLLIYNS